MVLQNTPIIYTHPVFFGSRNQGCTNPRRLVARVTNFCSVAPNIASISIASPPSPHFTYQYSYQFTCTERKAPATVDVHRSLQHCGSPVWNLLHVTLLVHRSWRWLLEFWKICVPFVETGYIIYISLA
jgi:hypothetical protein